MKEIKLDLMDWKQIERTASAQINENKVNMVISEILLWNAKKEIKALGGKTLEEEEAEIKKHARNCDTEIEMG